MNTHEMQEEIGYNLPKGKQLKVVDSAENHDLYVIHTRWSYYRLEGKLVAVDATNLSYRLFYLLASELHWKNGNKVTYTIQDLCAHFKLSDSAIYAALAKLLMADAVRKVKRNVLALDPYLAFAGKRIERIEAQKAWDAETLTSDDPIYTEEV